ncbi:MAG: ParA family protein [Anaerolineae bacterium]|nr:MAG: ParA family protein [Anaerolineae bacterium]
MSTSPQPKSPRRIVISNSKGGVGKTTTAVNLGAGLAMRGERVLLVDLDTQGHVARALGVTPTHSLYEVLDHSLPPHQAITSARFRLDLLAGGRLLARAKKTIASLPYGAEHVLSEKLGGLEDTDEYDYVILDTAPSWDVLNVNALFYAAEVLLPISMEALAIYGMADFLESIQGVRKYNPAIHLRYVLPTFFDQRVRKSAEILQQLLDHFQRLVLSPIRYNVALSECPAHGKTIFEYAPRSRGSKDYARLVERIAHDG